MKKSDEPKDRMFQYAYDDGIHTRVASLSAVRVVEDTGLITKTEADMLWDRYYPDVAMKVKNKQRPQMVIWKDCDNETDYHTIEKEIDYADDLEVVDGNIYKRIRVKL